MHSTRTDESMTREEAQGLVNSAIDALISNDSDLLDVKIAERALSHRLAHYMELNVLPPLFVDCEYNRHSNSPKKLVLARRKSSDRELQAITVYPDIIVHTRRSDTQNTIVLEVKKPGESLEYDNEKLRQFRRVLKYQHAAHVVLGRDASGNIVRDIIWIDPDELLLS